MKFKLCITTENKSSNSLPSLLKEWVWVQKTLNKKAVFVLEFQFQKQIALNNAEHGWCTTIAFDLTKGHKACLLEGWTFIKYMRFYMCTLTFNVMWYCVEEKGNSGILPKGMLLAPSKCVLVSSNACLCIYLCYAIGLR